MFKVWGFGDLNMWAWIWVSCLGVKVGIRSFLCMLCQVPSSILRIISPNQMQILLKINAA